MGNKITWVDMSAIGQKRMRDAKRKLANREAAFIIGVTVAIGIGFYLAMVVWP